MTNSQIVKSFTSSFLRRMDGIVEMRPLPEWTGEIGLKEAQEDMRCLEQVSEGVQYPLLVYLPDVTISKEARRFFADHPPVSACAALLVQSTFQRILGNFFLGVNKVKIPLRLFTSETEAILWLNEKKQPVLNPHQV